MSIRLTPLVAGLPATVPFVGPEAQERQRARDVWMYADPENHDLRHALAAHHAIDPAHIQIGEGIDTLLGYLCRMTVAPGTHVVTSDGAYPTFNFHVAGYGGTLHKVPFRNDREDLGALAGQARKTGAALVYLSNPDNPMGTWHDAAAIERFIADLPETALLVLDEAYVDTAPPGTAPTLRPDQPNVIRMRTFSKAYGMAGARVGYAVGPRDLIAAFDRIRNHFGMNRIAQAGALAALHDRDHLTRSIEFIAAARARIAGIASAHGLAPLPSATNFVTVDCGRDGAFARRVLGELIARGIFVRMPGVAPLDRCIRIGAGSTRELDLLERHLGAALAGAAT